MKNASLLGIDITRDLIPRHTGGHTTVAAA